MGARFLVNCDTSSITYSTVEYGARYSAHLWGFTLGEDRRIPRAVAKAQVSLACALPPYYRCSSRAPGVHAAGAVPRVSAVPNRLRASPPPACRPIIDGQFSNNASSPRQRGPTRSLAVKGRSVIGLESESCTVQDTINRKARNQ